MPNHVDLIVTPTDGNGLRRTFGEAHRRYTGAINARFGWTGHLFQGRFGAVVMDEPHLLAAARYISLDPVAVGLASHAGTGHGRAPARISRTRMTSWQRWRRCARWSPILLPFSPHRPIPRLHIRPFSDHLGRGLVLPLTQIDNVAEQPVRRPFNIITLTTISGRSQ